VLRPALGHILPKEHHKWIDFIVGMVCKVRSRASACDRSCLYFIYHLSPHRSVFSSTVLAVQSTRTECFDALISRLQSPWRLQGLPLCSLPLQLSIPLRGGLVGFYRFMRAAGAVRRRVRRELPHRRHLLRPVCAARGPPMLSRPHAVRVCLSSSFGASGIMRTSIGAGRLGLLCARCAAGAVRIAVRLGASGSPATFVPCAMRRRRRSKLRLALRPLLVPSTEAVRQHGGSS
jgi:hypothetical protein